MELKKEILQISSAILIKGESIDLQTEDSDDFEKTKMAYFRLFVKKLDRDIEQVKAVQDEFGFIRRFGLTHKEGAQLANELIDKSIEGSKDTIFLAAYSNDSKKIREVHLGQDYPQSFWRGHKEYMQEKTAETFYIQSLYQPRAFYLTLVTLAKICFKFPFDLQQSTCINFMRSISDLGLDWSEDKVHMECFFEQDRYPDKTKSSDISCLAYKVALNMLIKNKHYRALYYVTSKRWPLFTGRHAPTNHVEALLQAKKSESDEEKKVYIQTILNQACCINFSDKVSLEEPRKRDGCVIL